MDRALLILSHVRPDLDWSALTAMSIGQRDEILFRLWKNSLGDRIDCYAECSECSASLEFSVGIDELLKQPPAITKSGTPTLKHGEYKIEFRPISSLDLAAASKKTSVEDVRSALVERCIVKAFHRGSEVAIESIPETVVEKLAAALESYDAPSGIKIDLRCAECRKTGSVGLDIVSLLWSEISLRAKNLLGEIDTLARAYGWNEEEILGMSARRRQAYIEMAG